MGRPAVKPPCMHVRSWLTNRLGKQCLGPLTGSTNRIFSAYIHLVEAWLLAGEAVAPALKAALALLRPAEWTLAAWTIPCLGDWGHIVELWPRIKPLGAPNFVFYYNVSLHDYCLIARDGDGR